MSEFRDVYSKITDRIIADLEQGVRPWMRPWHAAGKITRPLRHNGIPYKTTPFRPPEAYASSERR
jgi:antirestriction protein ArdC